MEFVNIISAVRVMYSYVSFDPTLIWYTFTSIRYIFKTEVTHGIKLDNIHLPVSAFLVGSSSMILPNLFLKRFNHVTE